MATLGRDRAAQDVVTALDADIQRFCELTVNGAVECSGGTGLSRP